MKEIELDDTFFYLTNESGNVRVKSNAENIVLINQQVENISQLIVHNFEIVRDHYKSKIKDAKEKIDLTDICHISIKIVLYYIFIYNSWRNIYKKQRNKDLKFQCDDLKNASTSDIIIKYYKNKYPDIWENKCCILLDMNIEELKEYFESRRYFYNK